MTFSVEFPTISECTQTSQANLRYMYVKDVPVHKIWTPCAERQKTAQFLLTSFGGTERGVWGVGWTYMRVTFFYLPVGKKKHRNIFSHKMGHLAKCGWILTYLKIWPEMSLYTRLLPGAIQLLTATEKNSRFTEGQEWQSCMKVGSYKYQTVESTKSLNRKGGILCAARKRP